jgi:hypothetical protein
MNTGALTGPGVIPIDLSINSYYARLDKSTSKPVRPVRQLAARRFGRPDAGCPNLPDTVSEQLTGEAR